MKRKTVWMEKSNNKIVLDWAERKYGSQKDRNIIYLERWLEFRGLTAKQALDEQLEELHTRLVPLKLLDFVKHYQEELGYAESSAINATNAVRSFYSHYGVPLMIQTNDIKPSKPVYQDYELTLEDISTICHASDKRGRAIILTGESLGWREGDIGRLLRIHVEPFLDREAPIMIKLVTEKELVLATGFLHGGAIKAIKEYLATRTDDCPYLFTTTQRGIGKMRASAFNKIIQDSAKRASIETGSYRLRFHCLRKFLISRLQDSGIEENMWKQIVGKAVREKAYTSTRLREAYTKALPRIDPTALVNNHKKVEELEKKIERLEKARMTELLMYFGEELTSLRAELAKKAPAKADATKKSGSLKPTGKGGLVAHGLVSLEMEEQITLLALSRGLRRIWDEQANENNHT